MFIIVRWIINALALLLVTYVLPGFEVASFTWALVVALFLGVVNAFIRPILFILTLPITILTLGIFAFFLNALMILLVSSLLEGFEVDSFMTAFLASIILWAVSWFTNVLIRSSKEQSHGSAKPPIIEG